MVKKPEELKKGLHCCLNNSPCEECPYNGDKRCLRNAITDCHAYILTLEADKAKLQAQNAELVKQHEWISVEDRLPEKPGKYLVYAKHWIDGIKPIIRCDLWAHGWDKTDAFKATHWMPLPEPPKEETI